MDEREFVKKLDDNGREIFDRLKLMVSRDQGLMLLPTDGGYHLCSMKDGTPVRIIQIWPSPKNWLESRIQFMEDCVVLSDDDKKEMGRYLANAGFNPTSGDQGNMKFRFGAIKGHITKTELDRIELKLIEISKIIRRAPMLSAAQE